MAKGNHAPNPVAAYLKINSWPARLADAWSLHEFRGLPVRPWVIGQRKLYAVRNRRVAVKQKNIHGIRLGISQVHVAQQIKRLRSYLTGVRREAMSDF